MPMNKTKVRKKFLLARKISLKRKKEASSKALEILACITKKYSKVLSFASTKDELDLWPLNKQLLKDQKLLLPKVSGKTLKPYTIENLSDLKSPPKWKILEPTLQNSKPLNLKDVTIVLVPALAFDQNGYRLGHGFGYYDRFLKEIPHAYTIGIGFKELLSLDDLPIEPHDIALKALLLF